MSTDGAQLRLMDAGDGLVRLAPVVAEEGPESTLSACDDCGRLLAVPPTRVCPSCQIPRQAALRAKYLGKDR